MTIMVLTFYDGILLSSVPHVRATHSLQAELFVSFFQDQLQSKPCVCCHFDSHFHHQLGTVLITLANNHLFSNVLKMSAEEMPPKVTTNDSKAPTLASEDTSTLVKPRRIYSPSKHFSKWGWGQRRAKWRWGKPQWQQWSHCDWWWRQRWQQQWWWRRRVLYHVFG